MTAFQETKPTAGNAVKAPIVLVHGILGFDRLPAPFGTVEYFRGVPSALRACGNTVPAELPRLDPAGSVAERAAELKTYLDSNADVAGQRVHLVAHSMGGLDSRYMISRLGMADRVITLTTIGTPHRGTLIADLGIDALMLPVKGLIDLGIDIQGVFNLTTKWCADFNSTTPDVPSVEYFSIAGTFTPGVLDLLKLTSETITLAGKGPSDGLVPVESATYGRFLGTWNANHFRLINWPTNILIPPQELTDHSILDNYCEFVRQLASEGF